ncbi:MAG: 50S ribosomal protein L35 [Candidatus Wildermuthbacteria bacterium]|nr:50S ribosomal protein L35 [Candidatus Wildermuthbacteria bacterium]
MPKIKAKTRKSITKRFKITKNGKILRRKVGQDHLLAKQTGKKRRQLRKLVALSQSETKMIRKAVT